MNKISLKQPLHRTVATVLCVVALSMPASIAYGGGGGFGGNGGSGGKVSDGGSKGGGGGERNEFSVKGKNNPKVLPKNGTAHFDPNDDAHFDPDPNISRPGRTTSSSAVVAVRDESSCSKTQHKVTSNDQVVCDDILSHE